MEQRGRVLSTERLLPHCAKLVFFLLILYVPQEGQKVQTVTTVDIFNTVTR